MSEFELKMIYHSFFHSVFSYRIIFRENLSQSITIFQIQKKLITWWWDLEIGTNVELYSKLLNIFPLKLQYIFSLIIVIIINNKSYFTTNADNHNILNPYPTAFPYGNGMVLHFYQQQESSTTKTVHKVINKGLKAYV